MTEQLKINPNVVHGFIELLDTDDFPVCLIPINDKYTAPKVAKVRDYMAIEWAEDIMFAVNQYSKAAAWEESVERPYSGFHRIPLDEDQVNDELPEEKTVLYATDVLERLKQGVEGLVSPEAAQRVEDMYMGANPVHVDAVQAMLTQFDLQVALLMVMDRAGVPEERQEALYHYVNKTEQFMFGNEFGSRKVLASEGDWELVGYEMTDATRVENLRDGMASMWLDPSVRDDIVKDPSVITTVELEIDLDEEMEEAENE